MPVKALITGASSGLGRDMARALARRGWSLILVARRADRLEELARELDVPVTVLPMDLTAPGACRVLYEQVREEGVDLLVNNAGRGVYGPFLETDLDAEQSMLELNMVALHTLMKFFLRDFTARGNGRVLNVASSAAFLPGPLLASYYASKAYVLRLSQGVREELRRAGSPVTVSVLCPGPVETEFDRVAGANLNAGGLSSARVAEFAIAGTLRGRELLIPGGLMRAVKLGVRFLPDRLAARICWSLQARKGERR